MAMVVSSSKPSEREYNIGLIEMATGVGFLLGPIWGSFMYQMGGYSAPFGSTALCYVVSYPCMAVVIWRARAGRLAKEISLAGVNEFGSSAGGSEGERFDKI